MNTADVLVKKIQLIERVRKPIRRDRPRFSLIYVSPGLFAGLFASLVWTHFHQSVSLCELCGKGRDFPLCERLRFSSLSSCT